MKTPTTLPSVHVWVLNYCKHSVPHLQQSTRRNLLLHAAVTSIKEFKKGFKLLASTFASQGLWSRVLRPWLVTMRLVHTGNKTQCPRQSPRKENTTDWSHRPIKFIHKRPRAHTKMKVLADSGGRARELKYLYQRERAQETKITAA